MKNKDIQTAARIIEKSLFSKQQLHEVAAYLFSSLHSMEDDEQIKKLLIEPVIEEGLGIAITDRIKKAVFKYESIN